MYHVFPDLGVTHCLSFFFGSCLKLKPEECCFNHKLSVEVDRFIQTNQLEKKWLDVTNIYMHPEKDWYIFNPVKLIWNQQKLLMSYQGFVKEVIWSESGRKMTFTLPETNIEPGHGWKTSFLLGRPIFRCYVSFRECNLNLQASENWLYSTQYTCKFVNIYNIPLESYIYIYMIHICNHRNLLKKICLGR